VRSKRADMVSARRDDERGWRDADTGARDLKSNALIARDERDQID
jgi:hypothetical protein